MSFGPNPFMAILQGVQDDQRAAQQEAAEARERAIAERLNMVRISGEEQRQEQAAELQPGRVEAQQAGIEATRAGTAGTEATTDRVRQQIELTEDEQERLQNARARIAANMQRADPTLDDEAAQAEADAMVQGLRTDVENVMRERELESENIESLIRSRETQRQQMSASMQQIAERNRASDAARAIMADEEIVASLSEHGLEATLPMIVDKGKDPIAAVEVAGILLTDQQQRTPDPRVNERTISGMNQAIANVTIAAQQLAQGNEDLDVTTAVAQLNADPRMQSLLRARNKLRREQEDGNVSQQTVDEVEAATRAVSKWITQEIDDDGGSRAGQIQAQSQRGQGATFEGR